MGQNLTAAQWQQSVSSVDDEAPPIAGGAVDGVVNTQGDPSSKSDSTSQTSRGKRTRSPTDQLHRGGGRIATATLSSSKSERSSISTTSSSYAKSDDDDAEVENLSEILDFGSTTSSSEPESDDDDASPIAVVLDAKWDPYERSNWGEVKLVEPLAEGVPCGEDEVVLVASDKKTRFACNIKALKFYSKFAQGILGGDVEEDVPLDYEMATAITLQQFVTWLKRHETVVRSKQPIPMPMLWTIDQYYSDKWDIAFIRQHFVGEEEDMTKHEPLMELVFLSVYLQCEPLTEMICTYVCWHVKNATDLDVVERWCAGNVRNKNKRTLQETVEWIRGILKEDAGRYDPGPKCSMLSDDEYSTAPCGPNGDDDNAPPYAGGALDRVVTQGGPISKKEENSNTSDSSSTTSSTQEASHVEENSNTSDSSSTTSSTQEASHVCDGWITTYADSNRFIHLAAKDLQSISEILRHYPESIVALGLSFFKALVLVWHKQRHRLFGFDIPPKIQEKWSTEYLTQLGLVRQYLGNRKPHEWSRRCIWALVEESIKHNWLDILNLMLQNVDLLDDDGELKLDCIDMCVDLCADAPLRLLLDKFGSHPNYPEVKHAVNEVVWWAARRGKEQLVKVLAEYGATLDHIYVQVFFFYDDLDLCERGRHPRALEILHKQFGNQLVEVIHAFDEASDDSSFVAQAAECWSETPALLEYLFTKTNYLEVRRGRVHEWASGLQWASSNGVTELVTVLLDRDPTIDVNAKDVFGRTALMKASAGGHLEVVKILLDQGVDLNAENDPGWTALMLASDGGHVEVVKMLLATGKLDLDMLATDINYD